MEEEFTNSKKLKKAHGRGKNKLPRKKFQRGYNQLRMCDREDFIAGMMRITGMNRNRTMRVISWGLASTHQRRGYVEQVEKLFLTFKIYEIWDD